jgi:hypothetical protein
LGQACVGLARVIIASFGRQLDDFLPATHESAVSLVSFVNRRRYGRGGYRDYSFLGRAVDHAVSTLILPPHALGADRQVSAPSALYGVAERPAVRKVQATAAGDEPCLNSGIAQFARRGYRFVRSYRASTRKHCRSCRANSQAKPELIVESDQSWSAWRLRISRRFSPPAWRRLVSRSGVSEALKSKSDCRLLIQVI